MTFIFAFELFNAWGIVSDKLEVDFLETKTGDVIVPDGVTLKIEKQGNWILGFAGDSKQIDSIKGIFYEHINVDQGFVKICEEIKGRFKEEINVQGLFFDIIKGKCYRMDNNATLYEVPGIQSIGKTLGNRGKSLLTQLVELKSWELREEPDDVIKRSVSVLDGVSRIDSRYVGNPYIFGCDIFIIKDGEAKKYEIVPDGYLFREENKEWKKLER